AQKEKGCYSRGYFPWFHNVRIPGWNVGDPTTASAVANHWWQLLLTTTTRLLCSGMESQNTSLTRRDYAEESNLFPFARSVVISTTKGVKNTMERA
ncbi:MAG: hypothetical protein M1459_02470, partial [Patescibacteria group bacterium]|nr:hypothetical protein [Patescibacteria group bacterium]